MATPLGGLTPDLVDAFTDAALNNPWISGGLVGLSHLVPAVYQKIKQGLTKTKYGITNEKKFGKKSKLYRRRMFKRYKWINNYYRYKLDFAINVFIPSNTNHIDMRVVGDTVEHSHQYDTLLYPPSTSHYTDLNNLFNEKKVCGISIIYKPYQITKTDPDANTGNRTPNILIQILTGIEAKQNPLTALGPTDQDKQNMVDYPFSRLIAADDDLKMYRPFGFKKVYSGYNEQITDDILHRYVPSTTPGNESRLLIRTLLLPGFPNVRNTRWDLGTITCTLYIRFRNSKI